MSVWIARFYGEAVELGRQESLALSQKEILYFSGVSETVLRNLTSGRQNEEVDNQDASPWTIPEEETVQDANQFKMPGWLIKLQ